MKVSQFINAICVTILRDLPRPLSNTGLVSAPLTTPRGPKPPSSSAEKEQQRERATELFAAVVPGHDGQAALECDRLALVVADQELR